MSLNLKSSGGGSVTVDVPSTASNYTATLPAGTGNVVVNGINGALVSGTLQASTSGTNIDFTGIPSWVKRITVMMNDVSLTGTATPIIQLGTSGGVENTGYYAVAGATNSSLAASQFNYTSGFGLASSQAANALIMSATITNISGNIWMFSGTGTGNTSNAYFFVGRKSLGGVLDRIRFTNNGSDTFDAGSINIMYE